MLLSQAMLKSAPEMTTQSANHNKGSRQSTSDIETHDIPNGRQRSASLFLTQGSSSRISPGPLSRISPPVVAEKEQREAAQVRRSRTNSQPAEKNREVRRVSHQSPPAGFDPSRRRNTEKPQQEKKTLRQMFHRLTTKNDAATMQFPSVHVEVHPYTEDPTIAWEILKASQPVKIVKPMNLDSPISEDRIRFVCISDTHSRSLDKLFIPDGDVFLMAGDFTSCGHPKEIIAFNKYLGTLPHRYKVVICGNHELPFDPSWNPTHCVFPVLDKLFKNTENSNKGQAVRSVLQEALLQENVTNPRQLLTNCIYLEDSVVTLFGLKIYGAPWVPKFDGWAYNLPRGQHLLDKWNRVPPGVDVLLTHSPPLGHGDLTTTGVRAGCVELLNSIRKRIRPKYHVFGHIHEGYGCTTDGYTKFINCCTCDVNMKAINQAVLFDIALPYGYSKS